MSELNATKFFKSVIFRPIIENALSPCGIEFEPIEDEGRIQIRPKEKSLRNIIFILDQNVIIDSSSAENDKLFSMTSYYGYNSISFKEDSGKISVSYGSLPIRYSLSDIVALFNYYGRLVSVAKKVKFKFLSNTSPFNIPLTKSFHLRINENGDLVLEGTSPDKYVTFPRITTVLCKFEDFTVDETKMVQVLSLVKEIRKFTKVISDGYNIAIKQLSSTMAIQGEILSKEWSERIK